MTTVSTRVTVKTGQVHNRRALHFQTIEQAIAEAERLAAADASGRAECLGNWTVGQILNHLGGWAELAYGGNPIRIPWFMRPLGRLMLKRFLKKGLPAGHSIPKVPGGTLAREVVPTAQGLARLRAGFTRLKTEAPAAPHPFFGRMTHEQWIALNLRHAELHMSFVCI